ncbi:MAG: DUF2207 domain-containing protein [Actinobacteria bacterium]|nr:DUF2207 domain-containing protein [Actinomycetota bacterium]
MMFAVGCVSMYLKAVCPPRGGRNPACGARDCGGRVVGTLSPFAGGLVRKFVLLAFALVLAAACAGLTAGPAAAKDYSVTDVVIDAQVQPNGNLKVHEARTLDFSGTFHYVYWDYATRGSQGVVVTGASGPSGPYELIPATAVPAPDTWWFVDSGDNVHVQLNFEVTDTSATFAVDYVAKGAAKRWDDIAELYWQFVGDQAQIPVDHVRVTVHLPAGVTRDQVRAWAHGPLWGNVTIEPDASVVMTVDPLPAETFVEGRILFPAAALSTAKTTAGAREAVVLAEEKKWADQANSERFWARVKVIAWSAVGFGFPLIALILVIVLYIKYGREPKTQFQAQYWRDIPQPPLPPALVGFIWHMGTVARDDATATLLDLVNRKVIDIERVTVHKERLLGKDDTISYKLTLHDERLEELLPYERHLVTFLFHQIAESQTLVLSELKELAKTHRAAFAKGYSTWTSMVTKEGERRKYLDAQADRMAFTGAALAFVGAVAAGAAAIFSGWLWFFVGIPVCVVLVFVARAIKRRSQEAAELHAQYAALERYLKDFGRLQEKPPDAVVLWEAFLVYAVVFGIADEVVKAMTVKVPEVIDDPAFRTGYFIWFASPGDGGMAAFNEMHQSFGEAVSVATSSSSSGSGGGGGFSGGGGGGGGGGGFGAG